MAFGSLHYVVCEQSLDSLGLTNPSCIIWSIYVLYSWRARNGPSVQQRARNDPVCTMGLENLEVTLFIHLGVFCAWIMVHRTKDPKLLSFVNQEKEERSKRRLRDFRVSRRERHIRQEKEAVEVFQEGFVLKIQSTRIPSLHVLRNPIIEKLQ